MHFLILDCCWNLKLGEASSSPGSEIVNFTEITDGKLFISAVINSERGLKIYEFN